MLQPVFSLLLLHIATSMVNFGMEGDACNRNDNTWYAVPKSRSHFIYCHPKHGIYIRDQCTTSNGVHKVFDANLQQCVMPSGRNDQIASLKSSNEPIRCVRSSDCPDETWLCSNVSGRCVCRQQFTQIGSLCLKKVGIESGECQFDKQCAALWPSARCVNRRCACVRPSVAVATSRGTICTLPDECPLGGTGAVLWQSWGCHLKGGCGFGNSLNHFFDCISTSPTKSFCCPNKALTCMQPVMPGNGQQRLVRYYYNSITDRCVSFTFRGGNHVNTNVFSTKFECDAYCRSECPRGSPQRETSGELKVCARDDDCGPRYACFRREVNDLGFCCPKPEWVCSAEGGRVYNMKSRGEEFDPGTVPLQTGFVLFPVIRYYFSSKERRCKPFLYHGEGGNFNQFLTGEHCQQFCAPVICGSEKVDEVDGKVQTCSAERQCSAASECRAGICCQRKHQPCVTSDSRGTEKVKSGETRGVQCCLCSSCAAMFLCLTAETFNSGKPKEQCCTSCTSSTTQVGTTSGNAGAVDGEPKLTTPLAASSPMPHYVTATARPSTALSTTESTTSEVSTTESTTSAIVEVRSSNRPSPLPTVKPTIVSPIRIHQLPYCPGDRRALLNEFGRGQVCGMVLDTTEEDAPQDMSADASLDASECESFGDYACAFSSISATVGFCCESLKAAQFRCPRELVPLLDSTGKVVLCSPYTREGTSSDGRVCVFDELYGSYHFCRDAHLLGVPTVGPLQATTETTTSAVLERSSAAPSTSSTVMGTSPSNSTLEIQSTVENTSGCPRGEASFVEPVMGRVLECDPRKAGTCPPGYACYRSALRQRYQCCGLMSYCPLNSAAYVSAVSNDTVRCDENAGCPRSFFCFRQPNERVGICCSDDPVTGLCDQGIALQDSEGKAVRCVREKGCIKGYHCLTRFNISLCCPTAENVCSQPAHNGLPCSEAPPQDGFYFDERSRRCGEFTYSGCSGNDNRFSSSAECDAYCESASFCPIGFPLIRMDGQMAECFEDEPCLAGYYCVRGTHKRYCCPKTEMVCSLPLNNGSDCSPITVPTGVVRWHFSSRTAQCAPFSFHGCAGNYNRFSTKERCNDACFSALCPLGLPLVNGDGELERCSKLAKCPGDYLCMNAKFGFVPFNVCCPRPEKFCDAKKEFTERCPTSYYRYRYNSSSDRCERFLQGGCVSAVDSFSSVYDCQRFCSKKSALCPSSLGWGSPSLHTERAQSCSPVYDSCPVGFRCVSSTDSSVKICCPIAQCPSGKSPLTKSNGSLVKCRREDSVALFDGCPPDFICQLASDGEFVCCPRASIEDACPYPSRPFARERNQPALCSEGFPSCPVGFTCRHNDAFSQSFCCSYGESSSRTRIVWKPDTSRPLNLELCDDRSRPLIDAFGVRICHPHLPFSCPNGYHCEYNSAASRNQCCANSDHSNGVQEEWTEACPWGMKMYPHPRNGFPIVCQSTVEGYCPRQSTCEYSSLYWQFICCAHSLTFSDATDVETSSIPSFLPGEAGCRIDEQCQRVYSDAKCVDWMCVCPDGHKIYNSECVRECPVGHEDRDGLCAGLPILAVREHQ